MRIQFKSFLLFIGLSLGAVQLLVVWFVLYQQDADLDVVSRVIQKSTEDHRLARSGQNEENLGDLKKILQDYLARSSEVPSSLLKWNGTQKSELSDFEKIEKWENDVHESLFQMYRLSWNYKWMTVGRILSDLITEKKLNPDLFLKKMDSLEKFLEPLHLDQEKKGPFLDQVKRVVLILKNLEKSYEKLNRFRSEIKTKLTDKTNIAKDESSGPTLVDFSKILYSQKSKLWFHTSLVGAGSIIFYLLLFLFVRFFYSKQTARLGLSLNKIYEIEIKEKSVDWDQEVKKSGLIFTELQQTISWVIKVLKLRGQQYEVDQVIKKGIPNPYLVISESEDCLVWNYDFCECLQIKPYQEYGVQNLKTLFSSRTEDYGAFLKSFRTIQNEPENDVLRLKLRLKGSHWIWYLMTIRVTHFQNKKYFIATFRNLEKELSMVKDEVKQTIQPVMKALQGDFSEQESIENDYMIIIRESIDRIADLKASHREKLESYKGFVEVLNHGVFKLNPMIQNFNQWLSQLKKDCDSTVKMALQMRDMYEQQKSYFETLTRNFQILREDTLNQLQSLDLWVKTSRRSFSKLQDLRKHVAFSKQSMADLTSRIQLDRFVLTSDQSKLQNLADDLMVVVKDMFESQIVLQQASQELEKLYKIPHVSLEYSVPEFLDQGVFLSNDLLSKNILENQRLLNKRLQGVFKMISLFKEVVDSLEENSHLSERAALLENNPSDRVAS